MKIKIILMPLAIAAAIGISIWLIWPVYTNGVDGIKELSAKMKKETEKFSQLEAKIANTGKLFSTLTSDSQKSILYGFVPEDVKEEEIIDNVNYIASTSGASITDLDVAPAADGSSEIAEEAMLEDDPDMLEAESGLNLPAVVPIPQSKKIEVDTTIIGSYDSIRKFIIELHKLERHSIITSLSIKPLTSSDSENQAAAAGTLTVDAKIEFDMLPPVKISSINMNDPVFLSGNLDTAIFSKIKKAKSREVLKMEITQKGKSNPFMP